MENNFAARNGLLPNSSLNYSLIRPVLDGTSGNRSNLNYTFALHSVQNCTSDPSGYSHLGIVLTSFFVTVVMILIVMGNLLLIIAIITEMALKTVQQNWFIASLAVSDFLVGLVVMPFSLARELMERHWIFSTIWCEIHTALDVFLCTASINSLCLIILDRYWFATHATWYLKKWTPQRSIVIICLVWLLSYIISLPPLLIWKITRSNDYAACLLSTDSEYALFSAITSFFIPAFIIVFVCCLRACHHLQKKHKLAIVVIQFSDDHATKDKPSSSCTNFSRASPPNWSKALGTSSLEMPIIPESNGASFSQLSTATEIVTKKMDTEVTQNLVQVTLSEKMTLMTDSLCSKNLCESPTSSQLFEFDKPHTKRMSICLKILKFLKCSDVSGRSLDEFHWPDDDLDDFSRDSKKNKFICESSENLKRQMPTEANKQNSRIAKSKDTRETLVLELTMASSILAWLPFYMLYVLEALCTNCYIGNTTFAVALWLGYCRSVINPIIYIVFNRYFRKAVKKIFCR